jgi:hypothetical protein
VPTALIFPLEILKPRGANAPLPPTKNKMLIMLEKYELFNDKLSNLL